MSPQRARPARSSVVGPSPPVATTTPLPLPTLGPAVLRTAAIVEDDSVVEPWYAALTIEIMVLSRIGFDPNLGIETWLTNKATADGKPIEGLETIEEQIAFLDGLSLSAQRQLLLSTLEEGASLDGVMDELIDAWRRGDTGHLERELLATFEEFEELNKAILVDRNNRWVRQISALLDDEQDYLIVVGALHLVGDNGVPRQLHRQGAAVRQLSESATLR